DEGNPEDHPDAAGGGYVHVASSGGEPMVIRIQRIAGHVSPDASAGGLLADHETGEVFDLRGGELALEPGHLVLVAVERAVARVGDHRAHPGEGPAPFQVRAVVLARAVEVVAGVAVLLGQEIASVPGPGRVGI